MRLEWVRRAETPKRKCASKVGRLALVLGRPSPAMAGPEAATRSVLRIVFLVLGVVLLLLGLLDTVAAGRLSDEAIENIVIGAVLLILSRVI